MKIMKWEQQRLFLVTELSQRTLEQNPSPVQIARVNGHNMSPFPTYFGERNREIASLTKN